LKDQYEIDLLNKNKAISNYLLSLSAAPKSPFDKGKTSKLSYPQTFFFKERMMEQTSLTYNVVQQHN